MYLDGVRVVDLTWLLPGPYGSQLLADAGADVVKIENPDRGDYARHLPPMTERGVGAVFDAVNRGKRSVGLDLQTERGRDVFFDLVSSADVVFEQFRPGIVEKLGVDYESVKEHNSEVIYCSLSGYGQSGEFASRAGHDLNFLAVGGLLDMNRNTEDEQPRMPGYPVADMSGGVFAAFRITLALAARELGQAPGGYIDVSMTDVMISFSQALAYSSVQGTRPRPGETLLTGKYPCYGVYKCADGSYVTLAAIEEKFWRAFCTQIERADLVDAHCSDDESTRKYLRSELEDVFARHPRDVWVERLGEETMTAPVFSPQEILQHNYVHDRGLIERSRDGSPRVKLPGLPTDPTTDSKRSPGLGEHTAEILRESGYTSNEMIELSNADIISGTDRE